MELILMQLQILLENPLFHLDKHHWYIALTINHILMENNVSTVKEISLYLIVLPKHVYLALICTLGIQKKKAVYQFIQMQPTLMHILWLQVTFLKKLMNILYHVEKLNHSLMVLTVLLVMMFLMQHQGNVQNAQYYSFGTQRPGNVFIYFQTGQILQLLQWLQVNSLNNLINILHFVLKVTHFIMAVIVLPVLNQPLFSIWQQINVLDAHILIIGINWFDNAFRYNRMLQTPSPIPMLLVSYLSSLITIHCLVLKISHIIMELDVLFVNSQPPFLIKQQNNVDLVPSLPIGIQQKELVSKFLLMQPTHQDILKLSDNFQKIQMNTLSLVLRVIHFIMIPIVLAALIQHQSMTLKTNNVFHVLKNIPGIAWKGNAQRTCQM